MPRELAKYTTVGGVTYPPGPVDDEVAEQITNPTVWVEDEKPKPVKKAAAKRSASK